MCTIPLCHPCAMSAIYDDPCSERVAHALRRMGHLSLAGIPDDGAPSERCRACDATRPVGAWFERNVRAPRNPRRSKSARPMGAP